jgi:protein associated with RNAse G/E
MLTFASLKVNVNISLKYNMLHSIHNSIDKYVIARSVKQVNFFDRSWFNICGISSSNGQNACTSVMGSSFLLHAFMPWAK